MKSFLVKDKIPIIKWTLLSDNIFYKGNLPDGYDLAICPGEGYVVLDVDYNIKKGKNGFKNIPLDILYELEQTFNYKTKNDGRHYWFKYTGNKALINKTSGLGFDLRVENKGYIVYYHKTPIEQCLSLILESNDLINEFLHKYFTYLDFLG